MIAGVVVPTLPGECGASRRVAIATPSTAPAVTASRQCRLARVGGSTLKPYPVPPGLPTRPRAFARSLHTPHVRDYERVCSASASSGSSCSESELMQ